MILRPPEYLEDVRERELEMQAAEARLHELDNALCPHCDYRDRARLRALPELPAQAQGALRELLAPARPGLDDLPLLRDRGSRRHARAPHAPAHVAVDPRAERAEMPATPQANRSPMRTARRRPSRRLGRRRRAASSDDAVPRGSRGSDPNRALRAARRRAPAVQRTHRRPDLRQQRKPWTAR